ncbi:hypothetical protein CsatA_028707 [Cannabis sativa]
MTTIASHKDRLAAWTRARELTSGFELNYPTFLKPMNPLSVSDGSWLRLPKDFVTKYLPEEDEIITLIDKEKNEFKTNYMAKKRVTLYGGWKEFAIAHNLEDGDILVFRLIRPLVFEVLIIRVDATKQWGYD